MGEGKSAPKSRKKKRGRKPQEYTGGGKPRGIAFVRAWKTHWEQNVTKMSIDLGIPDPTIRNYMKKGRVPDWAIRRLAEFFGTTEEEICLPVRGTIRVGLPLGIASLGEPPGHFDVTPGTDLYEAMMATLLAHLAKEKQSDDGNGGESKE